MRILRLGLYFSLVSAFSLGRKGLDVGNWISRIQKKEYTLRPTGWVRTLAGSNLLSMPSFWPSGQFFIWAASLNKGREILGRGKKENINICYVSGSRMTITHKKTIYGPLN